MSDADIFNSAIKKLKPCPFCGGNEFAIRTNNGVWRGVSGYGEPISVEIQHWCPKEDKKITPRMISRVGRNLQDAIDQWNMRA